LELLGQENYEITIVKSSISAARQLEIETFKITSGRQNEIVNARQHQIVGEGVLASPVVEPGIAASWVHEGLSKLS
jgi:hypothetical protein